MSHDAQGDRAAESAGQRAEVNFKLPIEGFQGTPEEVERQWFEKVYKGRGDSMVQLTWRAILMGTVLGAVLSLTNLYIGLKPGWGFNVAVTACIVSYAIWTVLYRLGIANHRSLITDYYPPPSPSHTDTAWPRR